MIRNRKQLKAIVIKNLLIALTHIDNAQMALKTILKDESFLSEAELNALYDYGVLVANEEIARMSIAKKSLRAITGNYSYTDVYKMERKAYEKNEDEQDGYEEGCSQDGKEHQEARQETGCFNV